jgi:hypothetical protein
VDADLEQKVIAAARLVKGAHCLAHSQRGGDRPIGRERRHHRVADSLDHGARLAGNDFLEHSEMGIDQVKGDQIPDPLVKFRRALEIGKQEGQAGDF